MKLVLTSLLFASSLLANQAYKKDIKYTCLNTHSVQKGKTYDVEKKDSEKNPFIFSIKKDKLITSDNATFNFMMEKNGMSSYSNEDYMLLLTKDFGLGLVPKKSRGQIQYYFKCANN